MSESYKKQFEELIKLKEQSNEFGETADSYIVNMGNTKFVLDKKHYKISDHIVNTLRKELDSVKISIASRLKLFITNSNVTYEDDLKELFKRQQELEDEIRSILDHKTQFIESGTSSKSASKSASKASAKASDKSKRHSKLSPNTVKKLKKELLEQFRFKTLDECLSRKHSKVYYTSKEEMVKVLRANAPELIPFLIPALSKASKSDICKVIFS